MSFPSQDALWWPEYMMFEYEFTTSLTCRLLLLAIREPRVTGLISVFCFIVEILVRVWFSMKFGSAAKQAEGASEEERLALVWNGQKRTMDNIMDMQVEYVGPIVGAAMTHMLLPTMAFRFGGSSEFQLPKALLQLLGIQLIPELIADAVLTMVELQNGLEFVYDWYLSRSVWELALSACHRAAGTVFITLFIASLCVDA